VAYAIAAARQKGFALSAVAGSAGGALEGAFIEIVVESWRLTRTFARVLAKLDAGECARFENQLRFFQKRLEETLARAGLKLVNLEGHPYDAGMAASPLNIADFAPDEHLVVDQMVEPVIMGGSGIVRTGTVMLKRQLT
jgi:hypothetical protein